MKFKTIALILLAAPSLLFGQGTDRPKLSGELSNKKEREEEFMDWGLGLFVHWSFDSQLGSVISHHMSYASQKHLDRVVNELPKTFNPRDYDPDEWMEIAKLAGVKYMVFTTKHHSGFCMWDTKTTDFSIMKTAYKKDTVKPYVEACRRHGIKVGFYFSPEDWIFNYKRDMPPRGGSADATYWDDLTAYNYKQLDELFTNYGDIDVIFFDGGQKEKLTQYIHKISPNTIVTRGEMATPEQRLPKDPIPGPWETCFTLGTQWHYKPTNEAYKSGSQLINMLIETRAKGGNLLINVGPHPNGKIPIEQEERFRELALWMFVNDEAIHDIRPCVTAGDKGTYFTQSKDGKTIYAFLTRFTDKDPKGGTQWGRLKRKDDILITQLEANGKTTVSILGQDTRKERYNDRTDIWPTIENTPEGIKLSLVRAQRLYNNKAWPNAVVLKFENATFRK